MSLYCLKGALAKEQHVSLRGEKWSEDGLRKNRTRRVSGGGHRRPCPGLTPGAGRRESEQVPGRLRGCTPPAPEQEGRCPGPRVVWGVGVQSRGPGNLSFEAKRTRAVT